MRKGCNKVINSVSSDFIGISVNMYHIFHDMPVSDLPEQMYFNQSIKHVNISVNIVMSLGLECMGPRFD